MESPVVLDKPPEYHGNTARNNDRGFPFDEEEGSGAWSELAARHPDIAARLRQRPAAWARKRRPSSQDTTDDFGDEFGGFDRFPFDDIPPEFREHFPSRWNRRFGPRDEAEPQPQPPPQQQAPAQPPSPPKHTAATQTEQTPGPSQDHAYLPQYGLRNTVDLGQKSPADPSLVDAEERGQRSMSAPPDNRGNQHPSTMNDQNHHEQPHSEQSSNVRHIPIFVEGRDEPVINKNVDHGEPKPAYVPPPQPHPHPHVDREQYFADDGPVGFHPPPNFSRAFGTPFNTFRQGPQPFAQQKVYPQTAFARGASPQRSQSPKPNFPKEEFVKVPVHHEYPKGTPSKPKPAQQAQPPPPPQRAQQPAPPHKHPTPPQHKQPTPPRQEPAPQEPQSPPQPKPQPSPNDPITQILSIQTDVLNLMTEVENFTGTKKDKRYIFLDEMLTRNLIKLDNIETEGKENIRQARKEAIKCIQKCIAVLEAKADNNSLNAAQQQEQPQESPQDVEMKENAEAGPATENGEVEMKEPTKEDEKSQQQVEQDEKPAEEPKAEEQTVEPTPENKASEQPQAVDTRPEENKAAEEAKPDEQKKDNAKKPPSKGKNVKKRDKSKDKKAVDSNKEQVETKEEVMQVDDKGDKVDSQTMEVDSAASQ